ncbi:MAG TPA: NTP transferase domain-containing protein [Acidimicrobiia bacterium]|nr:NTP transferase domain-containing protein [Acidimicrobiia bacterium]
MAIVGLVPAAGRGSRLGLKAGSKEAQSVRGRPVIEYLLDRLEAGGADRVIVVVRPDKNDVTEVARRRGVDVIVDAPPTTAASFERAARDLDDDDIVLFGFPDTIWTPEDGFVPLRILVEGGEELALGIFVSPDVHRSDVVVVRDGRVVRIEVKPDVPASEHVWACGAARVSTFRPLARSGELGIAMGRRASVQPIAAAMLGRVIDVGTPDSFEAAEHDPVFG